MKWITEMFLEGESPTLQTINDQITILAKCTICGSEKSRFIKKQKASGVLSNFGLKTPLSKIPLLGDILL